MNTRSTIKYIYTWIGVLAFRILLLSWRAPNVEPLLASVMPISAGTSILSSVLFASSSIVVYDILTAGIGYWTLATAIAYGLVAVASQLYFRRIVQTRMQFVGFGIVATVAYDALTGLTVGPLVWHQTLTNALIGQIPFTLLHLVGTILFAALLSPVLARWYAIAPATNLITQTL